MSRPAGIARDDLQRMAEHVLYEIDMFRRSFEMWRALKEDDACWNSTLEAALLHFRVLREFFCSTPKHEDDVVAADFVTQAEWKPPQAPILDQTKEEIDKRLAHLTTKRLQGIPWKRGEMQKAMEALIASFKSSLCVPESDWFCRLETKHLANFIIGDISLSTVSITTIKSVR